MTGRGDKIAFKLKIDEHQWIRLRGGHPDQNRYCSKNQSGTSNPVTIMKMNNYFRVEAVCLRMPDNGYSGM